MRAPRIAPKHLALWLVLCFAFGSLLSWLSGMPLWGGMLIVAGALFINGLVASIEDEAPGGFLNPQEKDK